MELLASFKFWTIYSPLGAPPGVAAVDIRIVDTLAGPHIMTGAACFAYGGDQTTEAVHRAIGRGELGYGAYFATEAAALAELERRYPFREYQHNETIHGRILDAIRWRGELCGVGALADIVGVSRESLYELARGKRKATSKQAAAALSYHGGTV